MPEHVRNNEQSSFNVDKYMEPFWESTVMYRESVMMVSKNEGLPEGALLFAPIHILSVESSSLDAKYTENIDWCFEDGKLKLPVGSSAPYMAHDRLYPAVPGNTVPKIGGGYVYFMEGPVFHQTQLSVTYTHAANAWKGPIPRYESTHLACTLQKLSKGLPVKVVLFGDSIALGCNASAGFGIKPHMPGWGQLLVDHLKKHYTSAIICLNSSMGGMTSEWGRKHVNSRVTVENPDLVMIAFGMNDGTAGVEPAAFQANIQAMLTDVRARNPDTDFILVSTTLANPETFFAGRQTDYKAVLQQLTGKGIAFVDMMGVHQELLRYKAFVDMTGNNVNHPNDFLIRWYAQYILHMLIQPGSRSSKPTGVVTK